MSVNRYLESANRGDFQWQCIESTDGIGFGGVAVETVNLKGRTATITRYCENEFEVEVTLKHATLYDKEKTYEVLDYRSCRRSARNLAERLIRKDIEKDEVSQ